MAKLAKFPESLTALISFSLPCSTTTIEQRVQELPEKSILSPLMPVGVFLQEAYNLFCFAQEDKALFLAKNFTWGIVEELPARIDFLRSAEAAWWLARFRPSPAVAAYRQLQASGDTLYKTVMDDIAYACADDKDICKKLANIKKLSAESDYAARMKTVGCLARSVADRLAAIGSDVQQIATLEQHAEKLRAAYATYSIDFEAEGEQLQRDRAYTFCAVAVEAVRQCARYAFNGDRKKLLGYTSEYFRKSTNAGKGEKKTGNE